MFEGMEHLPMLFSSLFFFCGFKNLKIGYNHFLNTIAGTTLTVYLVHDNWMHRNFVWQIVFRIREFYNSTLLIPYSLFCVCTVFSVGCVFELLRKIFIEKYILRFYDFLTQKIEENKKER